MFNTCIPALQEMLEQILQAEAQIILIMNMKTCESIKLPGRGKHVLKFRFF